MALLEMKGVWMMIAVLYAVLSVMTSIFFTVYVEIEYYIDLGIVVFYIIF